jgi:NTP pyrophosphatase (non-canonical NTP hydrolase)
MKSSPDPEKELLYRHLKLSEEFGELSNDVMAYLGHQRQEKLDSFDQKNLWYEVVDVVISALIVGKMVDIDFEQAFEEKIKKIIQRFNNFE